MDLGLEGRTAAVAGGVVGPRPRRGAGAGGGRGARGDLRARPGTRRDGGRRHRPRGRDRGRRVDDRGRLRVRGGRSRGAGAGGHPRAQRRRPAARNVRLHPARGVPACPRAEPVVHDRHVRGRGPAHVRARLGSGGGDHVHVGPPADPEPDPVEHGPLGRHRLPEDVGPRGGGEGGDRELGAARPPRHRPDAAALRRRRDGGHGRHPGGHARRPHGLRRGGGVPVLRARGFVVGAAVPIDGGAYRGLQ